MKTKPHKFKTPEDLQKAIDSYFDWADKNPVALPWATKASGDDKKAKRITKNNGYVQRPYTLHELAAHIHVCKWANFRRDNIDRDGFREIIEATENKITGQQIVGGMCGIYSATLTARLNGLAEEVHNVTPPQSTIEIRYTE